MVVGDDYGPGMMGQMDYLDSNLSHPHPYNMNTLGGYFQVPGRVDIDAHLSCPPMSNELFPNGYEGQ
jgi:hypothetical protein